MTIETARTRPLSVDTLLIPSLREGRKSQTRCLSELENINMEPDRWENHGIYPSTSGDGLYAWMKDRDGGRMITVKCPLGVVGDLLWIRERWICPKQLGGTYVREKALYRADIATEAEAERLARLHGGWHPAHTMPLALARIWQRITGLSVQRVQDISEKDAKAEGIADAEGGLGYLHYTDPLVICNPIKSFSSFWQKTRPDSWERNEWVWVVAHESYEKGGEEL
ncbi:hypothetical protein [Telluribacter humicola]|uniref:hypothetical protein n=1 Tax=Telluribacter humicola TaxID=1720261 RepID=UPI001A971A6A|nr:hypothetical protein [Telluribacter humicola]